ncbi:MAG: hypothetical protein HC914_14030 [Chloroflexaceae bacterium]|nr:hypothetical protein [Chloroflexaceae bacterium]
MMDANYTASAARIIARAPDGTETTFLPNTGCGHINTRTQEVAGPNGVNGTATGYNACTIDVDTPAEEGIWEIRFISPGAGATGQVIPLPRQNNFNWPSAFASGFQANNGTYVSAWDVTVADAGDNSIPGRVYTNYFANTTGRNEAPVNSTLYVLSFDGALYRVDLNGLDGFTSIFFANVEGFRNGGQTPLYRSIQFTGGGVFGNLPPNIDIHTPEVWRGLEDQDTGLENLDIAHKLFFNTPAADLPLDVDVPIAYTDFSGGPAIINTTWLLQTYALPPQPTDFKFFGVEGTPNQAGVGLGGYFSFNIPNTGQVTSFKLTLDFPLASGFTDRVIAGTAQIGNNTVFWDGLDGSGNVVDTTVGTFDIEIEANNGEIHFPVFDAETNTNGFEIERLNPLLPGETAADRHRVYYDDSYNYTGGGLASFDYSLCADNETPNAPYSGGVDDENSVTQQCYGTPPAVRSALIDGVDSQGGAHEWTFNAGQVDPTPGSAEQFSGFGNKRGIDTWTFIPSPPATITGLIILREADLSIDKSITSAIDPPPLGGAVQFTVLVDNPAGASNLLGIQFIDQVPSIINVNSWSCTITTGTGQCVPSSGTTNDINTLLNLDEDSQATIIIDGTATIAGANCNLATVQRPPDVNDPDETNNSSGVGNLPAEGIGSAMSVRSLLQDLSAPDTFIVVVDVEIANIGNSGLTDVNAVLDLAAWLGSPPGNTISDVSVTSTDFTVNASYDGDGGSDPALLETTGNTLAAGENGSLQVTFRVNVPPANQGNIYQQTASVSGDGPNGLVTDLSNNGSILDTGGPGDLTSCDPQQYSDPTPLNFSTDVTSVTLASFDARSGASLPLGVVFGVLVLGALATAVWFGRGRRTS